ncbi:MAG: hypothetical protein II072_07630 [Clostridia bacterium]|nr:hypothetical protein [Clostridia bacterium]
MKKKKTIAASQEPAANAPEIGAEAGDENTEDALKRLGAAFIARLNVPEGMTTAEAVEAILSVWEKDGGAAAPAPVRAEEAPAEDEPEAEEEPAKSVTRLPKTLRGGLGEAPEADYESMSAEQFRRLKKQLQRAAADGRKIRL